MDNFQRIKNSNLNDNKANISEYSDKTPSPRGNPSKSQTSFLVENDKKDLIINNQKSRIYQLEQREKDIDNLNKKFKDLQKNFNDINDYKNRLEFEIKRKDNNYNTDLSLLKSEKDAIQFKYNEGMSNNKKLMAENDYLQKEVELKKKEIERLNTKISDLSHRLNEYEENYIKLSNEKKELNDMNDKNNNEIKKLMEDNCRLSNLCQELHISLQKAEKDKENMANVIEDKNMNIENLNNKLNMQEENFKYLNEQINDGNITNNKLQKILKELNDKIDNNERENNDLKNNLLKEKNIRINEENLNKRANDLLLNKEIEINNLNKNYEDIINKQKYLNDENCEIKLEIERYKNNCKLLREQNNNLMNEIQNIISIQEKVQDKLIRKERIKHLLDENKNILQQSYLNLDDVLYNSLDAKSFV